MDASEVAFFAAQADGYMPLAPSRGYWKHDSIKGPSIVGLLGYEMDRRHGDPGLVPVRLNVDMFRMAQFAPVTLTTKVVKESRRLRLVTAELSAGGQPAARATLQLLKPTQQPAGAIWSPGPWSAPHPETLASMPKNSGQFELRHIAEITGHDAPRQAWTRGNHALIEGVALTPYARVALIADFASPFTHGSDMGINYINTDVTLHLHRLPVGEWLGMEVTGHEASQGIAIGSCRVHDTDGPIGYVTTSALAQERRRGG